MRELEGELKAELDRLSELIDRVGEHGTAKSQRQALQSAAQLARLRERMIDRHEEDVTPERTHHEATQAQRLESLRALVRQHAESLGYVKR